MSIVNNILSNLPEVSSPTQKKLPFKEKLKWTIVILIAFYVLGMIPVFGASAQFLEQFEYLKIILAAEFGSVISLGIGPIVTGSIVLQLLNGSGIWNFDLTTPEGKRKYQGIQKMLAIFFIVFEACIYVFMGGISPDAALMQTGMYRTMQFVIIGQLFLGGIMIMLMDEVISKWGFGSGISLFIAAGVSKEIFIKAFSFDHGEGSVYVVGHVWRFFQAIFASDLGVAGTSLGLILSTVLVFALAVYMQAMKVEIPLSFGRVRGHGIRWPLNFLYTSNIPVILVSALFANFQIFATVLNNAGIGFLGDPTANTGLVSWFHAPGGTGGLVGMIMKQGFDIGASVYLRALGYLFFMVVGSVVFSYFWVQTAGMDARSQAKQMMSSGLQIPGFRRDQRVLERLLQRYIGPLTILGGISIGVLAATADLLGALSRGTGILLTVMIIYKLYEEIAKEHMMDMHPALRKMME